MKKSLSIILSLAMVCTMSATAFAADSSTDLSAIADATIQVTQTTSESGAITNTFNNLDDFVNAVHTANPAISDYEIATYILDYTGQEYQDLPEEEILSFLTYDNISTLEMSRNVQSGNTQNLKSTVIQRSFPKWSVAERRKTAAASDQAAVCACTHSRYFAGGSPIGLRV